MAERLGEVVNESKSRFGPTAKGIAKGVANAATLGISNAVIDNAIFTTEKNRIAALNKKVIQNCTDIKDLALVLSGRWQMYPDINPSVILDNIIDRMGDDTCENALEYNSEIDDIRYAKDLFRRNVVPKFRREDEQELAGMWSDINADTVQAVHVEPENDTGAKIKKKSKKRKPSISKKRKPSKSKKRKSRKPKPSKKKKI